jgi:hypothetical protein
VTPLKKKITSPPEKCSLRHISHQRKLQGAILLWCRGSLLIWWENCNRLRDFSITEDCRTRSRPYCDIRSLNRTSRNVFNFTNGPTYVMSTKLWNLTKFCELTKGRSMGQEVNHRRLTAETWVRASVIPCGICGGQSDNRTGASASSSVFPCQ